MWQVAIDTSRLVLLDVSSLLGTLIGGAVVLVATILSAKLERSAKQEETKTQHQRDTLIELQEAVVPYLRATYAIYLGQDIANIIVKRGYYAVDPPDPKTGKAAAKLSEEKLLERVTESIDRTDHYNKLAEEWGRLSDSRFLLQMLKQRIDNQAVRDDVDALVAVSSVRTEPEWNEFAKISDRLHDRIGTLLRAGVMTKKGFVAREDSPPLRVMVILPRERKPSESGPPNS